MRSCVKFTKSSKNTRLVSARCRNTEMYLCEARCKIVRLVENYGIVLQHSPQLTTARMRSEQTVNCNAAADTKKMKNEKMLHIFLFFAILCAPFRCRNGGMADTTDLKSVADSRRRGSSPLSGTIYFLPLLFPFYPLAMPSQDCSCSSYARDVREALALTPLSLVGQQRPHATTTTHG